MMDGVKTSDLVHRIAQVRDDFNRQLALTRRNIDTAKSKLPLDRDRRMIEAAENKCIRVSRVVNSLLAAGIVLSHRHAEVANPLLHDVTSEGLTLPDMSLEEIRTAIEGRLATHARLLQEVPVQIERAERDVEEIEPVLIALTNKGFRIGVRKLVEQARARIGSARDILEQSPVDPEAVLHALKLGMEPLLEARRKGELDEERQPWIDIRIASYYDQLTALMQSQWRMEVSPELPRIQVLCAPAQWDVMLGFYNYCTARLRSIEDDLMEARRVNSMSNEQDFERAHELTQRAGKALKHAEGIVQDFLDKLKELAVYDTR